MVYRESQVQQEAGSTLHFQEAQAGDTGIYNLQDIGTTTTHVHVIQSPHASPAPS